MIERCLMTGTRATLALARKRLSSVVSHTSTLTVDVGGLWLTTDCIHHDLRAIARTA